MDETRSPPLRSVLCYWPEMSRLASVDIMLMNASLFELIPFLVHSIDFSSGGCWGGRRKETEWMAEQEKDGSNPRGLADGEQR